jgi:hypothetical protein
MFHVRTYYSARKQVKLQAGVDGPEGAGRHQLSAAKFRFQG